MECSIITYSRSKLCSLGSCLSSTYWSLFVGDVKGQHYSRSGNQKNVSENYLVCVIRLSVVGVLLHIDETPNFVVTLIRCVFKGGQDGSPADICICQKR